MRKGPHPSLAYLTLWKNNRDAWKFNKKDQTYLLKHAFDSHVVRISLQQCTFVANWPWKLTGDKECV